MTTPITSHGNAGPWSTHRNPATTTTSRRPDARATQVEPIYYLFLLPALVLFTLAITLPAIMGIFFSFTNSVGFGEWEFVGLINYLALFSDPAILRATCSPSGSRPSRWWWSTSSPSCWPSA